MKRVGGCRPVGRNAGAAGAPGGFTLIEVLVTLVILSTGIVLVLQALDHAMVALDQARDVARMTLLAESREAGMQAGVLPLESGYGACEEPYGGYGWEASLTPQGAGQGRLAELALRLRREGRISVYESRTYVLLPAN